MGTHVNNLGALQMKGVAAFNEGRLGDAEIYFRSALKSRPGDAETHNNLGQVLRRQGQIDAAREQYWCASKADAQFAEPVMNLGLLAAAEDQWSDAIGFYAEALNRRSNYAEAHFNWAIALERLNDPTGAEGHYRRALKFRPGYIQAINNLGVVLDGKGAHADAEQIYREGLAIDGNVPELWASLGTCLRVDGRLDEAKNAYDKALGLNPEFPECRWNLSLIELAEGDFAAGWANYRNRPSANRQLTPYPRAPFENLSPGRVIEILGEQGLGDELFFLRFAAELSRQGAAVKYRGDDKLRSICRRLDFIEWNESTDFGAAVSVADIPYLMGAGNIPQTIRLQAASDRVVQMQVRLAEFGPPPYLGVNYRAGIDLPGSLFKSVPPFELGLSIRDYPGTLINIQRGPEEGGTDQLIQGAGRKIFDLTSVNDDLEYVLALMALLDHVAGVSNTNMHLRAAVGGSALVLVGHPAEYRWMANGAASPWFPNFELVRQEADGSWEGALGALSSRLAQLEKR